MQKVTTWAGLDVHAERIVIAIMEGQVREPEMRDIPNEPKAIRRTFQRLAAGTYELRCCYEAGPCGFELHRQLTNTGITCEVVAPSLIPVKAGDRVKTDQRDAHGLAGLYRAGELTTVTVTSAEQEAVRDLVRARDDVRMDLTAARHRLGKFLIRRDHLYRQGGKWTQRIWAWMSKLAFEREGERLTFEHNVAEVQHLAERRASLDREIERIARTGPYATTVGRLSCLRGISTLSALALVAEIGDFHRFCSPRQLMANVGLVPRECSKGGQQGERAQRASGGHERRTLVSSVRHGPKGPGPAMSERGRSGRLTVMRLCRKATRESQSDSTSVLPRPPVARAPPAGPNP